MSKYAGEQVLVVKRSLFEEVGAFQGICTQGVENAMEVFLSEGNAFFIDREGAENDPSHKQLIPYCVFRHNDRILHYTRGKSGGENRLHSKISIGVGGHINPVDLGGETASADSGTYHAAVTRELQEELILPENYSNRVVALINDDSNSVGEVHLGVVHLIELDTNAVSSREDALTDLGFAPLAELNGPLFDRLETWSQFCVRHFAERSA